jgi:hypothetical protein
MQDIGKSYSDVITDSRSASLSNAGNVGEFMGNVGYSISDVLASRNIGGTLANTSKNN